MAKKTAKKATSPGGGSKEEQQARLEKLVGDKGIKAAKAIVDNHDANVVRLAFKMLPKVNVKLSDYDRSMMEALGLTEEEYLKAKASRPK